MAKEPADWLGVNVDTKSAKFKKAYANIQEGQKALRELRESQEEVMREELLKTKAVQCPVGFELVFGYRFGQLSVAAVAKKSASARKTV